MPGSSFDLINRKIKNTYDRLLQVSSSDYVVRDGRGDILSLVKYECPVIITGSLFLNGNINGINLTNFSSSISNRSTVLENNNEGFSGSIIDLEDIADNHEFRIFNLEVLHGTAFWSSSGNHIYRTGSVSIKGTLTNDGNLDVNGNADISGNLVVNNIIERSSIEYKTDINNLGPQLSNLLKLRPVNYVLKQNNEKNIGLILEEVEGIYPEFIFKGNENKGINYSKMVSILIQSIKDLNGIVEKQGKELKKLKSKMGDK